MFIEAVVLAVVAALVIACGAELQEHAAVRIGAADRRAIAFFVRLLRDPRWVAGALLVLVGVVTHIVALTKGPVVIIQPVGTVGLLFAVTIKAISDHTRLERLAVAGCVAVIGGLAVLLALLPHQTATAKPPLLEMGLAGACAVAFAGAALLLRRSALRPEVRAGAVALGAGMCFGVAAALVGGVGREVEHDVTAAVSWATLLVLVLLIFGGAAQQLAYRMERFAVVYAVLLCADPLTAGFAGVILLHEPMPVGPLRLFGLSLGVLVVVAGIAMLVHVRAANRTEPVGG